MRGLLRAKESTCQNCPNGGVAEAWHSRGYPGILRQININATSTRHEIWDFPYPQMILHRSLQCFSNDRDRKPPTENIAKTRTQSIRRGDLQWVTETAIKKCGRHFAGPLTVLFFHNVSVHFSNRVKTVMGDISLLCCGE